MHQISLLAVEVDQPPCPCALRRLLVHDTRFDGSCRAARCRSLAGRHALLHGLAAVRSKTFTAQVNEVLLKVLCYNLTVLMHSMHELGVDPEFGRPGLAAE